MRGGRVRVRVRVRVRLDPNPNQHVDAREACDDGVAEGLDERHLVSGQG